MTNYNNNMSEQNRKEDEKARAMIEVLLLANVMVDRLDTIKAKGYALRGTKKAVNDLMKNVEQDLKPLYQAVYGGSTLADAYNSAATVVEDLAGAVMRVPLEAWPNLTHILNEIHAGNVIEDFEVEDIIAENERLRSELSE
jgi:hypothetical protein